MNRAISYSIAALAFACVALAWQILAWYGGFPPKLVPGLGTIAATLVSLVRDGVLLVATADTLYRLILGFALAAAIGVPAGILMGRYRWIEDSALPVVSFFYPIPGLAYAPLFVLWFGLGDGPTILLIGIASSFVVILNTWQGVKAVKLIWLRSAEVMGARGGRLFYKVILPASLPYILVALRLGLGNAWRLLIAVEMVMSVQQGLGWLIQGAQTFLNTDVMLSSIAVIGVIGLFMEKQIFERIERYTLVH
ncbi:MAG: ABC transporter permease, partial [Acetobacteraceae bacterium]